MANSKYIYMPYYQTGASGLYARVLQVASGYWLDYTDGLFRQTPGAIDNPLTEVLPNMPSVYAMVENRTVWSNGEYHAFAYEPVSVFLFASADIFILDDKEVSQADLLEYMELIKKIEEGNWQLKDNKWIYYDTDGVTPLMEFSVFDKDGIPSMANIFKRVRI